MTGHIENKLSLPVGGMVEMNSETGIIHLKEAAVLV
jgi:hypothetical protein